jgi:hypothetical protein
LNASLLHLKLELGGHWTWSCGGACSATYFKLQFKIAKFSSLLNILIPHHFLLSLFDYDDEEN